MKREAEQPLESIKEEELSDVEMSDEDFVVEHGDPVFMSNLPMPTLLEQPGSYWVEDGDNLFRVFVKDTQPVYILRYYPDFENSILYVQAEILISFDCTGAEVWVTDRPRVAEASEVTEYCSNVIKLN